jgi:hypothetical protein
VARRRSIKHHFGQRHRTGRAGSARLARYVGVGVFGDFRDKETLFGQFILCGIARSGAQRAIGALAVLVQGFVGEHRHSEIRASFNNYGTPA